MSPDHVDVTVLHRQQLSNVAKLEGRIGSRIQEKHSHLTVAHFGSSMQRRSPLPSLAVHRHSRPNKLAAQCQVAFRVPLQPTAAARHHIEALIIGQYVLSLFPAFLPGPLVLLFLSEAVLAVAVNLVGLIIDLLFAMCFG